MEGGREEMVVTPVKGVVGVGGEALAAVAA